MKKLRKCHCCNNLEDEEVHMMDVSNGLTFIPICKDCYKKIELHAKSIEDILKLPLWSVNISLTENRYEENVE